MIGSKFTTRQDTDMTRRKTDDREKTQPALKSQRFGVGLASGQDASSAIVSGLLSYTFESLLMIIDGFSYSISTHFRFWYRLAIETSDTASGLLSYTFESVLMIIGGFSCSISIHFKFS
jgi:hypothetical protein